MSFLSLSFLGGLRTTSTLTLPWCAVLACFQCKLARSLLRIPLKKFVTSSTWSPTITQQSLSLLCFATSSALTDMLAHGEAHKWRTTKSKVWASCLRAAACLSALGKLEMELRILHVLTGIQDSKCSQGWPSSSKEKDVTKSNMPRYAWRKVP